MTMSPQRPARLRFSHFGISVQDIARMEAFYTEVLGFTVTDRGSVLGLDLVFLSRDPGEHHQIVLGTGRPDGIPPNARNPMFGACINQISFKVEQLDELRVLKGALDRWGLTEVTPGNHGLAWSLYFPDPEGNNIECFVDSPWYITQPFFEPFDLGRTDQQILADTYEMCRNAAGFRSYSDWRAEFAWKMSSQQAGRGA